MAELKLIYFEGCPNVERIRSFLVATGFGFENVKQEDLPSDHPLKRYSSPSLLKNNELIFGTLTESRESSCTVATIDLETLKRLIKGVPPDKEETKE